MPFSISEENERRHGLLWIWHLIGIAIVYGGASLTSWGALGFSAVRGWLLVTLVSVAYLAAAFLVKRLRGFPRGSHFGFIFSSITLAFLAVVAVLAFGRFYYSRSYLITGYSISLVWLMLAYLIQLKFVSLKFSIVPGGMSDQLLSLPGVEWTLLETPELPRGADGVVVDLHQEMSPEWQRFLSNSNLQKVPIYHSAVIFEAATGRVSLPHLSAGVLERFEIPPLYALLKRFTDVFLVLMSLPVVLPVGFLVALLVRLDSSGPIVFVQQRAGRGGGIFDMYKFRSMRCDAESGGAKFAGSEDPRITRIGHLIRTFRLDELPQFWNVLKGDMSLIGPRPEQVVFAEQFSRDIPYYSYRHTVRPGITGWAQVHQGYVDADETRDKLEFDLYYIKYLSFWLDVLIIFKTVKTILTGFGSR